MVGYAVCFLLGLVLGVAGLKVRQRRSAMPRPSTDGPPFGELPVAVRESVTLFGEELAVLDLGVDVVDAPPAVLEEYRAALAAYDRAGAARTEPDALAALRDGRAAVIRLAARRDGRPVPIDALPPIAALDRPPVAVGTGERHVATGSGPGTVEVLIDRHEPGGVTLAEIEAVGDGHFVVELVTRTEDLVGTGATLLSVIDDYRGRRLVPAEATHLRVTVNSHREDYRWSIRIVPPADATALAPEHRGRHDDVLRHDGGPAVVTVQFQGEGRWDVDYLCECLRRFPGCDCPHPAWPADTPGDWSYSAHGSGDGRRPMRLPRPGYLIVRQDEGRSSWYLTTRPVDVVPPRPAAGPGATFDPGRSV
ncbi:hypothetical protein [Kitasatospora sp. NPDC004289]